MTKPNDPRWAEDMIFDENLREFAHKIGLLVGLEQGKKLSPDEAYVQIKQLWKSLKKSHKNLQIGCQEEDTNE